MQSLLVYYVNSVFSNGLTYLMHAKSIGEC